MTKRMTALMSVSAITMAVVLAQPASSQVKLQFGTNSSPGYNQQDDIRDANRERRDEVEDAREDAKESIRDARRDPSLNKREVKQEVRDAKEERREDIQEANEDRRDAVRDAKTGTYIRPAEPGLTIQVN